MSQKKKHFHNDVHTGKKMYFCTRKLLIMILTTEETQVASIYYTKDLFYNDKKIVALKNGLYGRSNQCTQVFLLT